MIVKTPGKHMRVLVAGNDTDGRFAVVETCIRRGAEPPLHVHSREDELINVLEGRVRFYRNDERLDGPTGTWIFLPRGSEHTFAVESAEARLLVMLSPAGLEDYLSEPGYTEDPVPERQAIERLVATAARYGVSITGPARQP